MDLSLVNDDKQGSSAGTENDIVTFLLGDRVFGMPIMNAVGFIEPGTITPIPLAPQFVIGNFEHKGKAIPLIDLRRRLGLACNKQNQVQTSLLLDVLGEQYAVLVDAVCDVLTVEAGTIAKPSKLLTGVYRKYCREAIQHGSETILILDADKLLTAEPVFEEATVLESPTPRLRLVPAESSEPLQYQKQAALSAQPVLTALQNDVGFDRLAGDIAFRILDDDVLNPFLGSLNALQFPELIARYLKSIVETGVFLDADDSEAVFTRLVLQQGFERSHFDRVSAHVARVLSDTDYPSEAGKKIIRLLNEGWEALFR